MLPFSVIVVCICLGTLLGLAASVIEHHYHKCAFRPKNSDVVWNGRYWEMKNDKRHEK